MTRVSFCLHKAFKAQGIKEIPQESHFPELGSQRALTYTASRQCVGYDEGVLWSTMTRVISPMATFHEQQQNQRQPKALIFPDTSNPPQVYKN